MSVLVREVPRAARGARSESPRRVSSQNRFFCILERHCTKIAFALVLLATIRIVATYAVFSHTSDEPAHLACGLEWLERGVYRLEAQHPPLARVATAFGPYLLGRHFHPNDTPYKGMFISGLETYYEGGDYDLTLAASRLGVLPFFWIAAFVVYLWAKRDFGAITAVAALFLFTFLPPVLAHAGLATTDMALTAFLGAAFLAGRAWLERPDAGSGAIFGACSALAVLSKFSSLVYLPAVAVLAIAFSAVPGRLSFRAVKHRLPSLGVAIAIAAAIVWAAYRFSFGPVAFAPIALPAPELFAGIADVVKHNAEGHVSYLFGQVSRSGFPGFYFVVLAVKTPIAFLALIAAGAVFLKREWKAGPAWLLPAAYVAGILAVASFSRINIGVRHILPVYTGLSILAAAGLVHLFRTSTRRWVAPALALLLGWHTLTSLLSHPDYLPYFNAFAGSHPEKILVDSDLDWGQDMKRLEARMRAGGARLLALGGLVFVSDHAALPQLRKINRTSPVVGWTAIGMTAWKQYRLGFEDTEPGRVLWPDQHPPHEIVGKSIALWYFPPSSGLPLE
jgi:hypothetical protein